MTVWSLSGELPWAGKSSAPTMRDMSRTKWDIGDAVPYGRFAAPVRRTGGTALFVDFTTIDN